MRGTGESLAGKRKKGKGEKGKGEKEKGEKGKGEKGKGNWAEKGKRKRKRETRMEGKKGCLVTWSFVTLKEPVTFPTPCARGVGYLVASLFPLPSFPIAASCPQNKPWWPG